MGGRRGIISPSLLQGVLQTDGKTDIFSTFLNQTKTKQHFGFLARRERGRERDLLRMAKTVAGDINFVWGNCKDSYFFLRSDPLTSLFLCSFCRISSMEAAYVAMSPTTPTLLPVYDLCTLARYRVLLRCHTVVILSKIVYTSPII